MRRQPKRKIEKKSGLNEKMTYQALSKVLHVHVSTIVKYAKLTRKCSSDNIEAEKSIKKELSKDQEQWLELVATNPTFTKTMIKHGNINLYQRLYRNNYDWLMGSTPNILSRKPKERISWLERDKNLLPKVVKIYIDWDNEANKFHRITMTAIGKKLNQVSLITQHLNKMSLTRGFIEEITEDPESFQRRRMDYILGVMSKDRVLKVWEVLKLTG